VSTEAVVIPRTQHDPAPFARRLFAALLVGAVLLPLAAAPAGAKETEKAFVNAAVLRRALATHPLRTLDGKPVAKELLAGEVVVVSFWATWCKPCRKEMPRLEKLYREIAPTGGSVLAIALDLDIENVRRFVKANGLTLPVCHDGPDGLAQSIALDAVPLTVVLDRQGEIAYAAAGADEAQIEQLASVTRRLAGAPRTAVSVETAR